MITRLLLLISVAIGFHSSASAQSFDVVQSAGTGAADYGGAWGQTFKPTQTGPLIGIRLVITARQRSATDPYGSALNVRLHEVIDGVIQSTPVANGTFGKDTLLLKKPVTADIYFTTPYTQTAGQTLAFVVQSTSGGGANGWNDYANSNANPYSGGGYFSSYVSTAPVAISSTTDLVFSSITANLAFNEIRLEIQSIPTGGFLLTLPFADLGNYYRLEQSADLKTWTSVSLKRGENSPISWAHTPATPNVFYRVRRS